LLALPGLTLDIQTMWEPESRGAQFDLSYTVLRKLIRLNKSASKKLALVWPHSDFDLFDDYDRLVARYAQRPDGRVLVVDVGAGGRCPFRKYLPDNGRTKVVGVDLSLEAMAENDALDEKRIADVVNALPFAPEEVDLVVSRSVMEHLSDVERFFANSATVLKPGGYTIHVFPCRYAPFAIANRMLPNRWTSRLMAYLHPSNVSGFPAYYDQCYYNAAWRLCAKNGLEMVEARLSYYSSDYYSFFFPLFALSLLYEIALKRIGVRNLAADLLIVARKPTVPERSGSSA
jgi:SAM-dependent methyltransferase